ncbi:MAG: outer membrane protein assembly factor BamE, partial [Betaproteobacteria bacterium]|nr:outer membrane protein assembly factor BamE [Betaproteobacteria bacterium]
MISPYKIDIQQGNVVTQEMVDKLKAGQTRSQVRFVLGSPLVADMFHDDRWDYIYLLQRQGKPDERRR